MKKPIIPSLASIVMTGQLIGCASSIDRGSLSEAVDKAKDNHKGDRRVTGSG